MRCYCAQPLDPPLYKQLTNMSFGISTFKIDDHVLLKKKHFKKPNVPQMNGPVRKAIFKKRMTHNKYRKCRDTASWGNYRKA